MAANAPEPPRTALPPASGLLGRVVHLGLARGAMLAARAALFVAFGLALSSSAYGTAAVLLALGSAFAQLFDLGFSMLLVRRGAREAQAALDALGGLLALRLALLVPALGLYALCARALLGPASDARLVLSFGVYVLGYQVASTAFALLRGASRTALEGYALAALHAAEALATGVWLVATSRGLLPLVAALASLRALALAALVASVVARFGSRLDPRKALGFLRAHAREAALFTVLVLAQYVYGQADVLLLRALRGAAEVGRYWACYRLLATLLIPVDVLLAAAMPRLAEAAGDRARTRRVYGGVHTLALPYALGVAAAAVVHPGWIVGHLLGPQFAGVEPLLVVLGVGLGLGALPPHGLGLAMLEHPGRLTAACVTGAVANLALNAVLIPRMGAAGAAWATLGSYAVLKLVFAALLRAEGIAPVPARAFGRSAVVLAAWALASRVLPVTGSLALLAVATGIQLVRDAARSRAAIEGTVAS